MIAFVLKREMFWKYSWAHAFEQNFFFSQVKLAFSEEVCTNSQMIPDARFSKVPKLFGRISGDIILFASSKRNRLEARNFAVIFIFIPFTTYEKTSFIE